jgi:hypothetical protein
VAEKIKLVLEGDSKSLTSALDNSSTSLDKLATKSRDSVNTFAKWGAAATVAGAAVIAGIVNASRESIDALAKKSDQLGIATEKLAAFQHLGELTGVSTESMNSSLERMSKRLGEAAQGMGAAKPQLEALNLSAEELIKLSPDKQYEKIAEAVKGLSTQSEKAAATAAIFGREGLALLNTMEAGAEGFQAAEADVLAFGTAISRIDAAKVEEANDSFERVQQALSGVATQLTVELAPVMKVVADRFVDAARESGGFTDQIVSGINLAIDAVAFFTDMVRGLEVVWKLAEVAAMGFVSATLTGLDEVQKAAAGALSWIPGVDIAPSDALSEWAEESRQALIMTTDELGKLIDEPMPSTEIKKFFKEVKEEAQAAAEEIAETKKSLTDPVETEETAAETAKADPAIQAEIDAQAAKYLTLREMAEEFQLSEAEREVARYERENEQFNLDLEKLIENGLIVDEAVATQNQARQDAEAIHRDIMEGIAGTAEANRAYNMEKDAADTLAIVATQNEEAFELQKALSLAKAAVSLPSSVLQSFENGGGYPWGLIPAGLMLVRGLSEISAITSSTYSGQAHAGLDTMPDEGTMLLKRGEMVLDEGTSQAVRDSATTLAGGTGGSQGVTIQNINISTELTEQNSKSYVRDVLIPELNDAYRDGFLFGATA